MSKRYHTQIVKKNSVNKLFSHVQILETQCSYAIIKTYESTTNITQQ